MTNITITDSYGQRCILYLEHERYSEIRHYMISKDLTFLKGYIETITDDFRGRPVYDYILHLTFNDNGKEYKTVWEMGFREPRFGLIKSEDDEIEEEWEYPTYIEKSYEDDIYSDYISDIESCN